MAHITCIVPSAGKGKRLGRKTEKAFTALEGKPLIFHTLKALNKSAFIDDIIVVAPRTRIHDCAALVKKYKLNKVSAIVAGGKKRFDSVKNALKDLKKADYVLIHDGARPFIDENSIKQAVRAAEKYGSSILAEPSADTIKLLDKKFFVKSTPERSLLWKAQTPQVFKRDLIIEAYNKAKDRFATDDSVLVEKLGYKVKIVKGSPKNIKITTPEDLALARVLLRKSKQPL